MENFERFILFTPNPLTKAALFGKIFEELPTIEELRNGTPKLSPLFALNHSYLGGDSLQSGVNGTSLELVD